MGNQPISRSELTIRSLTIALILLAFAASAYFRFHDLRQYPGWYSDEGNHIDLAENWIQGEWKNYGVLGAPYSQRPPMFMYTIATAMSFFGTDISVTRGVSATANLLTIILAAWIAFTALGLKQGVLTFWLGAVAPWIVVFGRIGLTYNLMGLFFLFSIIALWYYLKTYSNNWLFAAAISAALAFATDYLGVLCGLTIFLALLICNRRAILRFLLITFSVLIVCFLPVLLVNSVIFFSDMRNLVLWGGGIQTTSNSLVSIIINYSELLRRESWILLGLCGLFMIRDNLLRNILLVAVVSTLIMVTRAYTPVGVGLHYLMHLFPVFAFGLAVFMLRAFDFLRDLFGNQLKLLLNLLVNPEKSDYTQKNTSRIQKVSSFASLIFATTIVFTPLIWMVLSSFAMVTYKTDYIFTGNDDLRLVDVNSADQVRYFLSKHTDTDDLVIGSPALIWGLPTMHRADFLAALAYNGNRPNNYIEVDRERYTYNLKLDEAAYVVIDPLAEEFAPLVLPGMDHWLEEIHSWPVVFEADDIRVYQRQTSRE